MEEDKDIGVSFDFKPYYMTIKKRFDKKYEKDLEERNNVRLIEKT